MTLTVGYSLRRPKFDGSNGDLAKSRRRRIANDVQVSALSVADGYNSVRAGYLRIRFSSPRPRLSPPRETIACRAHSLPRDPPGDAASYFDSAPGPSGHPGTDSGSDSEGGVHGADDGAGSQWRGGGRCGRGS